jgi:tripartite-type tricarboxylate transporter receptor subunit TctC
LLVKDLPYKSSDFTPLARISGSSYALTAKNDLPANDIPSFIEYAKANPGKVTYGTNGPGTFTALLGTLIETNLGLDLVDVPYQGAAPAQLDTIKGVIDTNIEGLETAIPNIEAHQYKVLAITAEERSPKLPGTPTFKELGYPDVVGESWQGIFGPAGLPDDVVKTLDNAIAALTEAADFKSRIDQLGVEGRFLDHAAFGAFVQSEADRWSAVVASTQK